MVSLMLWGCSTGELVTTSYLDADEVQEEDTEIIAEEDASPADTLEAPDVADDSGAPVEDTTADVGEDPAVDTLPVEDTAPVVPPFTAVCMGDGAFSIDVTARELEDFEGHAVWLSVAEPESQDFGAEWVLRVQQAATVAGGEVHFSCLNGLTSRAGFPSLAITIDADGNGVCSSGDLQMIEEFPRWYDDLTYLVAAIGSTAVTLTSSSASGVGVPSEHVRRWPSLL